MAFASWPYVHHLMRPWKLITFAVATALVTAAAPYSGDPTWDTADSLLISAVVFLAAPWSVARLYRDLAARRAGPGTVLAFALFWTPCLTYDLYLLWRDGAYPITSLPNLAVSGPITLTAGLFWNLGHHPAESSVFTFRWQNWPPAGAQAAPLRPMLLPALLLAVPVLVAIAICLLVYGAWAPPP